MHCSRSHGAPKPRGFTLIEVLIALAITSMVVSVLMSSVFYGAKVQSSIRQELVDREQLLRSKAWFVELLSTCLPADTASGSAFQGGAQEIVCDTLMPLQGRKFLATQRIRLGVRPGPTNTQQLTYVPDSPGSTSPPTPEVIAELPASAAEFSYIGINGAEVPKWPPQRGDPETLPRRILLKYKNSMDASDTAVWTVSLRATPWVEPKLTSPFGQALPR